MTTSNMYADAKTWNPFRGCYFDCSYCIPSFKRQAKRIKGKCALCGDYTPHFHPERLDKLPSSPIIFVCGCGDLAFATHEQRLLIIKAVNIHNNKHKNRTYYFQSKRPEIFKPYLELLNENCVIVTTLETNRNEGYELIAKAPLPVDRYKQFVDLEYPRKILTLEPLIDFDVEPFAEMIINAKCEYVWLGLNSKASSLQLPEPTTNKIIELVEKLQAHNITIKRKRLPQELQNL